MFFICPSKSISRILYFILKTQDKTMIIYLGQSLLTSSCSPLFLGLHQVEFTTNTLLPEAESYSFSLRGYPVLTLKHYNTFHLSPTPVLLLKFLIEYFNNKTGVG